ncbi:unnamed protein product [Rotaria magnacalcarata]|uniref:Uncharacterized protein n=1 Tax=Rotaria magnacalcarata TaxID=392030 RepID=A0A819CMC9_9BILA|nr:unnamed protein product [Rotaria magnacalcarata]
MTERARSSTQNISCMRSQSFRESRDRVTRTASELHRQTVNRVQRRFEQQLAQSEREIHRAMSQRRDYSSSPAEKVQATKYLQHLRTTLNNDYAHLVQDKVDEVGRQVSQRHCEQRQIDRPMADRNVQEALQEAQIQSERMRIESINEAIRERDVLCEEKLAAQKTLYSRLLEEQARRLHAEQALQTNLSSSSFIEHNDMAEVKGRLARVEYEHRELKQLILDLRSDLTNLIVQQPTYKSTVNIPNFIVKS